MMKNLTRWNLSLTIAKKKMTMTMSLTIAKKKMTKSLEKTITNLKNWTKNCLKNWNWNWNLTID